MEQHERGVEMGRVKRAKLALMARLGRFEYWVEALVLLIGLAALNLIFAAEAFRATDTVNPTSAGQLGDFVGGYVGTYFALVSVVLLTSTLRTQRRSAQILQFEAKYFELLRLHRDNVQEFYLQGVEGRRLFVMLLREYRASLRIVGHAADAQKVSLSQFDRVYIAYYVLLFGVGAHSSRMLREALKEFSSPLVEEVLGRLSDAGTQEEVKAENKLGYAPFDGHQSRLGHYYRHLYQAVAYVDRQSLPINKYEYVKTIRAQLSNQEQALLLLNSLSPIGRNWWRQGYLVKYRLVQNIPRYFFDPATEIDLSSLFPTGYFEWEEALPAVDDFPVAKTAA